MRIFTMLMLLLVTMVAGCGKSEQPTTVPAKVAKYHCPMHPQVVSDKPGDCPICGMKLVPIAGEGSSSETEPGAVPGLTTVSISPSARERMGLTLGKVEKRQLAREIRTSARIAPDETRLYRVSVKFEGWVDKLFVAVTGQTVKKGDPLLTVYSPDLVSAQDEYLLATDALKPAARRRLELWDITDAQIAALDKAGKSERTLTIYAPADGVVLDRMVLPGQKLMPNDALMLIGDLSVVWADADLYQSDLPLVKEGMTAEFENYTGKVTFISPTLDPVTRTAKARLEIPNPDARLKPAMFGTATLRADLGERLAMPDTAVMHGAGQNYAFKAGEGNQLIPVAITLGAHSAGWYEVLTGLQAGDEVVTSANFLIDSESSMKAALAGISGGIKP